MAAAGCSLKSAEPQGLATSGEWRILRGVEFVRQRDEFCGPAAMESVLRYYGEAATQDEIARSVYTPKLGGALISDMENFARDRGFNAKTVNGDFNAIASAIDSGAPAIALVDLGGFGLSVPHYYVIYGYGKSQDFVLVHTGYKAAVRMEFHELDRRWRKMNRLMLLIRK